MKDQTYLEILQDYYVAEKAKGLSFTHVYLRPESNKVYRVLEGFPPLNAEALAMEIVDALTTPEVEDPEI